MRTLGDLRVSRETFDRLEIYFNLLQKWNPKINLVSKTTLTNAWERHFVDSAQLYGLSDTPVDTWVDLGSGGGFPGMVISILSMETQSPKKITLVESDSRKCAFLHNVIRETGVSAEVINSRIENTDILKADVISARALADLKKLFSLSTRYCHENTIFLFPKGENWESEVQDAQSEWQFTFQPVKSVTQEKSVILRIKGVARV